MCLHRCKLHDEYLENNKSKLGNNQEYLSTKQEYAYASMYVVCSVGPVRKHAGKKYQRCTLDQIKKKPQFEPR